MVKTFLILVCTLILSLSCSGQAFTFIDDGCPSCCEDDSTTPPAPCSNTTGQTIIAQYGQAVPYPVTICVTNVDKITSISLTFSNYIHNFPMDVSVILSHGPSVYSLMFEGCGGTLTLGPLNFTLEDGYTPLPLAAFTAGTYGCNRLGTSVQVDLFNSFFVDTSTMPMGFASFLDIIPTGEWQVWILDSVAGDGGFIDGWNLTINGSPNYSGIGAP